MKQVAQQEAERARFLVEKVRREEWEGEREIGRRERVGMKMWGVGMELDEKLSPPQAEQVKQAAIISSSGDSQAAELLSKAFEEAGDGLIELRRLEAAEEIASTLSKSRNVAYLPGGGGGGGAPNLLLSIPP